MMTTMSQNEMSVKAPPGMTELVRGNDQRLIGTVAPLVREHSVTLDLSQIKRIDAAGIAALISLYGWARESGNEFVICNVCKRVEEILNLVGLETILVSHDVVRSSHAGVRVGQSAA